MKIRWHNFVVPMLIAGMVALLTVGGVIDPAAARTLDPSIEQAATPLPGEQRPLTNPPVSEALSDNWRVLQPGESHWYTFGHRGDELPVHIWMDVEPNEGAGFFVFDEESAQSIFDGADPRDVNAVGRGTTNPVEPGYLFWRGVIENDGTYYILVEHGWTDAVSYAIYAAGSGLAR
jgi:hypothetical protein